MKATVSKRQVGQLEGNTCIGPNRMTEQQSYLQFLGAVFKKPYTEMIKAVTSSPKAQKIAA